MTEQSYTCAHCKGVFIAGWSDEEARAEYETNMPQAAGRGDDEELVCDECYQKLMEWAAREGIDL